MPRIAPLHHLLSSLVLGLMLYAATCSPVLVSAAEADQAPPQPGRLSAAEEQGHLQVPDNLALDLVLAEPDVRQPLYIDFDERGRMWVVEYLQYPFPAGLTILSEDKFLRATYDKVPPPPPNHFRGADQISIHEDSDGDGTFDAHKVFLDGLNVATAVTRGRGGVWVLNPPYLLFYPDRDRDDVPDSDPEVHLQGFGLEDTHSVASSLQWGPDGWLYASQGSTVSGQVLRPGDKEPVHSMGQLIWRYHPETRRYEIFAEGGGNAFGVEIDSHGRLFSGHNGGDTRGFHYVQGGYYQKGFAKHGPLSNPYTFGYFPAMKHPMVPRFTHTFVIYEGGALPDDYNGKLFGVAPMLSHVVMADVLPDGSSWQTNDIAHPLASSDPWFRPVEIKAGPDGALYVSDFYEGHIAHLRHHEGLIDKTSGRIWRLRAKDAKTSGVAGALAVTAPFDLATRSSSELVELLAHENKWFRRMALRLLGDRGDRSVLTRLNEMFDRETGQLALEALWGLNACGGFDERIAQRGLAHANPWVRAWTVRLLGDSRSFSTPLAQALVSLALSEPAVEVRGQLACTARRLPADVGLEIVRSLLAHGEDASDIHLPLLVWWAIESRAETHREAVLALLDRPAVWHSPLVADHILHRLMRRYAATGARSDLVWCARLLNQAPDADSKTRLVRGFEEAFQGRSLAQLPQELAEALAGAGGGSVVLRVRQGDPEAVQQALAVVADSGADSFQRLQYVQLFGEVKQAQALRPLLEVVRQSSADDLRMAALASLRLYDEPAVAAEVLAQCGQFSEDAKSSAYALLASRPAWTLALLEAVDSGAIEPRAVPTDVVRGLSVHRDERIGQLISKHWGTVEGATTEQMRTHIERLEKAVQTGSGSPYEGKQLFNKTCAKCHRLFDQGGQIGPDLTAFKRDDVSNMLVTIVNPSAELREGYEPLLVITTDGRAVSGFVVDRDNQVLVLRGADGQNVSIAQDEIDELEPQRKSVMPEGLLDSLTDQQVRDLLAYLRSSQPLAD